MRGSYAGNSPARCAARIRACSSTARRYDTEYPKTGCRTVVVIRLSHALSTVLRPSAVKDTAPARTTKSEALISRLLTKVRVEAHYQACCQHLFRQQRVAERQKAVHRVRRRTAIPKTGERRAGQAV